MRTHTLPDNFEIIRLGEENLYLITRLFHYADEAAALAALSDEILSGKRRVYLLLKEGEPVGQCRVSSVHEDVRLTCPGKRVWMHDVLLLPPLRGKGIGQCFLEDVLSLLGEEGLPECTVGVSALNTRAAHIYEKLGFTEEIGRLERVSGGRRECWHYLLKSGEI